MRLLKNLWIAFTSGLWIKDRAHLTGVLEVRRARCILQGSSTGEELLQQGAAFLLEDAAAHLDAMVEAGIAYHVEE